MNFIKGNVYLLKRKSKPIYKNRFQFSEIIFFIVSYAYRRGKYVAYRGIRFSEDCKYRYSHVFSRHHLLNNFYIVKLNKEDAIDLEAKYKAHQILEELEK